jgi:hypothetical protein
VVQLTWQSAVSNHDDSPGRVQLNLPRRSSPTRPVK